MSQTTRLIGTAIVVGCALLLLFLADEKTAGVTLLLAVASGWGFPLVPRGAGRPGAADNPQEGPTPGDA
jgi:hypothetical protein